MEVRAIVHVVVWWVGFESLQIAAERCDVEQSDPESIQQIRAAAAVGAVGGGGDVDCSGGEGRREYRSNQITFDSRLVEAVEPVLAVAGAIAFAGPKPAVRRLVALVLVWSVVAVAVQTRW